jgi:hypothetical protein
MFFGLILGDLGYGAVLALLAMVGWIRSRKGGVMRSVSQIAAACAAFSMLFGLFFGEFFGDLGHELFGLHAVALQREEALVPFLVLTLALGFVHMMLGLILGALSSIRSDPRQSLGRGLAAVMLLLTAAVLLAAVNVLPEAFFTPAVVDGARHRIGDARHGGEPPGGSARRCHRGCRLRHALPRGELRPGRLQPHDSFPAAPLRGVLRDLL